MMDKTKSDVELFFKYAAAPLFASILLTGVFLYLAANIFAASACAAAIMALFYFGRKYGYFLSPAEEKKLFFVIAVLTLVLLLARFYRILSFPHDFIVDELTDIVDAYSKMRGDRGVFTYATRQGAALPLVPEAVYSVFILLFGHRIELIRAVPLLLSLATAAFLYLLGKEIRDKKFGVILCFLYASSAWAFYASRHVLGNSFIPFYTTAFLFTFFKYINSRNTIFLAAAGALFLTGFFTYTSWALMAPFSFYLLFEYRREIGIDRIKYALVYLTAAVAAAALAYISNKGILSWSLSRTVFADSAGPAAGIMSALGRLPSFFFLPLKDAYFFTDRLALLSFTEAFMLAGGLAVCAVNIRHRLYRVFLTGFFLSLFTLCISGLSHPRHIMVLPFLVIIMGFFMAAVVRSRFIIPVITVSALLLINSVFYMFTDWNRQILSDNRDTGLAQYINKKYKPGGYIFINTTLPLSLYIGDYSAYMHTAGVYGKINPDFDRVLFTSSSLLRYVVRDIFPWVRERYFYDYDSKHRLPIVLYDLDLRGNPELKWYFKQMAGQIAETNLSYWALDYAETANKCAQYCESTVDNKVVMLKNTFLRYTQLKAMNLCGAKDEMAPVLFDTEKPMFITADWCMMLAEGAYSVGDLSSARKFAKKAAESTPEWDAPANLLKAIKL